MQSTKVMAGIVRIVSLILVLILSLSGCVFDKTDDAPTSSTLTEEASYKVAYVPLDNRPVNQERMQYLAQSANIELIMPDEELYRTALDNMTPNSDGSTIGNRQKLCEWLLIADKECDHFIISLDQMTSGGLVSSRWLSNDDLTFEYNVIDTVLELCENNTVYLFDTVMRLASTVGYQGYQYEEYVALRSYGSSSRQILTEDNLTIENIIKSYPYDEKCELISTDLPADLLDQYHSARTRKIKLTDYALRQSENNIDFFYIGVDDSSPQNTIQTNEINYINTLRGEKSVLGAATDEIALCCLARMILELYGINLSLDVTYFGDGQNKPADGFDVGTLDESIKTHMKALGVNSEKSSKDVLHVLCLTRGSGESERNSLLDKIKDNQAKNIPTILIDVSEYPKLFAEKLIEDSSVDICQLLGYSSWNTASNAIGIALSQGVARYAYLLSTDISSQNANNGFLKSITFSYIKDISYKCFHQDLDGFMSDDYLCSAKDVLERVNNGKLITSINNFSANLHPEISISNLRYPWNRTFEITFDITIKED